MRTAPTPSPPSPSQEHHAARSSLPVSLLPRSPDGSTSLNPFPYASSSGAETIRQSVLSDHRVTAPHSQMRKHMYTLTHTHPYLNCQETSGALIGGILKQLPMEFRDGNFSGQDQIPDCPQDSQQSQSVSLATCNLPGCGGEEGSGGGQEPDSQKLAVHKVCFLSSALTHCICREVDTRIT